VRGHAKADPVYSRSGRDRHRLLVFGPDLIEEFGVVVVGKVLFLE